LIIHCNALFGFDQGHDINDAPLDGLNSLFGRAVVAAMTRERADR